MAQPNFEQLAGGFAVVAEEISKFANVPVINEGQAILAAVNGLQQQMGEQFRSLKDDITTLRTDMNTMRNDINTFSRGVNTQFNNLNIRMHAEEFNHNFRLFNSHITSRDTAFRPLHDAHDRVIEGFPPNSTAVARLPGASLSNLLIACGLEPDQANLEAKGRQFKQFIGVVIGV